MIGFRLGWVPDYRINALIGRGLDTRVLHLPSEDRGRRWPPNRNWISQQFDLGLPSIQNCGKIKLYCFSHPAYDILLRQLSWLMWLWCYNKRPLKTQMLTQQKYICCLCKGKVSCSTRQFYRTTALYRKTQWSRVPLYGCSTISAWEATERFNHLWRQLLSESILGCTSVDLSFWKAKCSL